MGLRLASCSLVLASLAACASPTADDPVASTAAPIVYGTTDTTHTAVVAILNSDSQGYEECSGTIVQVKGGLAYVLTAAHCCNDTKPSVVVMANTYNVGVNHIDDANPPAPTYKVIASSISFDPAYHGNSSQPTDDFCMFKFNAPANTPVIPAATPADGVAVGTTVEYVGYGVTESNQNNVARRHVSSVVDKAVTANTFSYTEGGTVHKGGPCEGDSGGPALVPAGATQDQQKVVGTTSYGDPNCQQYGTSMRVQAQNAPGGFIYAYLNDGTTGVTSSTTTTSSTGAGGGTDPTDCAGADGQVGCCTSDTELFYCDQSGQLQSQACGNGKACGWNAQKGYYDCVASAVEDPSGASPRLCGGAAGTTTTTASTGTGGSTCGGLTTGDATCDACVDGSCCNEAAACADDPNCLTCLTSANPPASCQQNQAASAFATCFEGACATACGGGTGGGAATSSTGAGGASSSSGTLSTGSASLATTSTGGAGGDDTSGGHKNRSNDNAASDDSGCGCSTVGERKPSNAALAGLLFGFVAIAARRRRR